MTVSGLASWWSQKGERLRFAATSDLSRTAFDSFVNAYGLSAAVRSFTQADDLKQVEALLKLGTVDAVLVPNLQETLTLAGFRAVEDDLQIFARDPLSVIIQASTVEKYPSIKTSLEGLAKQMTTEVIHDLVSRVRLLNESAEDVAREFLESSQTKSNAEGG
jgi:glycine betaine/choline ABC-type transport system substrate-binding protein